MDEKVGSRWLYVMVQCVMLHHNTIVSCIFSMEKYWGDDVRVAQGMNFRFAPSVFDAPVFTPDVNRVNLHTRKNVHPGCNFFASLHLPPMAASRLSLREFVNWFRVCNYFHALYFHLTSASHLGLNNPRRQVIPISPTKCSY
jgi:hypothetical protein